MKKKKTFWTAIVLYGGCFLQTYAQQVGVWYDTELQTDFKGNYNHVNLLYLNAEYQMNERLKLNAATISIAKTQEERLLDDLQCFSNIDDENLPLTLAVADLEWQINEQNMLCLGIRNVNEDYFTSPVTSLFINSSNGIFPTIANNMPIANYPTSSIGIHYVYGTERFKLQASAYNGVGYKHFRGRENIWRVTPKSDGIFLITQGEYNTPTGQYYLGACLHTGQEEDKQAKKTIWAYTEQELTPNLSLIADYSHAFGKGCECTDFIGLGAQYQYGRSTIGIMADYARFRKTEGVEALVDNKYSSELASELTVKYNISSHLFIQTSCQLIGNTEWQPIGLVRLGVRL